MGQKMRKGLKKGKRMTEDEAGAIMMKEISRWSQLTLKYTNDLTFFLTALLNLSEHR